MNPTTASPTTDPTTTATLAGARAVPTTAPEPTAGSPAPPLAAPRRDDVLRAVDRRSFCTLATTSPAGRPHVAGLLYAAVGTDLYVSTLRSSRKARNVAANPNVAVCIPVRRLPVGPPSSIQFQGRAELLELDDSEVLRLVAAGDLKGVTAHGELELPGGCFIRIVPNRRAATYGLGMSLRRLLRDPLSAAGAVELNPAVPGPAAPGAAAPGAPADQVRPARPSAPTSPDAA